MITNKKAFELSTWMQKSDELKELRFTISGNRKIQSNIKMLEGFVKLLEEVENRHRAPKEELTKAEELRISLVKPYCKLTPDGKIQVDAKNNLILNDNADEPEVADILNKFTIEHASLFNEYQASVQEWEVYFQTSEAQDLPIKTLDLSETRIGDDVVLSTQAFEMLTILIPELGTEAVEPKLEAVADLPVPKPIKPGSDLPKKRKPKARPAKSAE